MHANIFCAIELGFWNKKFFKSVFSVTNCFIKKKKRQKNHKSLAQTKTVDKEMTLKRIISVTAFLFILLQFLDFVPCSN